MTCVRRLFAHAIWFVAHSSSLDPLPWERPCSCSVQGSFRLRPFVVCVPPPPPPLHPLLLPLKECNKCAKSLSCSFWIPLGILRILRNTDSIRVRKWFRWTPWVPCNLNKLSPRRRETCCLTLEILNNLPQGMRDERQVDLTLPNLGRQLGVGCLSSHSPLSPRGKCKVPTSTLLKGC